MPLPQNTTDDAAFLREGHRQFWHNYLSAQGRINRRTYWLAYILPPTVIAFVFMVFLMMAMLPLSKISGEGSTVPSGAGVVGLLLFFSFFIFSVACTYVTFVGTIKRLHDMDMSGWFSLLITLGGIVQIVFGCIPGTPGPNRYGEPEDPFPRRFGS